jgi:chromosome segregation ATPase
MIRRRGATWVLWIGGLSILAVCRPVRAEETTSAGLQKAKTQLGDLEAASSALDSAGRGQADARERGSGRVLQAHKELIDFEMTQQKELAAREKELQEARGQIASLKADVEKLQAAAKQRDGEQAERSKERESLETKSREELASMRSQLEKLQASITTERQEREKASADAKRLQGEKQKLETELSQKANSREAAPAQRSSENTQQLSSLHSQLEKLEASLAEERKEREKAQSEVNRLQAERENLQGQLGQLSKAPEPAAKREEAALQESGTEAGVPRIKKWQKPDGSLFFGERPPPGSKLLGDVENMGTSGGGANRAETSSQ